MAGDQLTEDRGARNRSPKLYARALWLLLFVFFLRVVGQALVIFFHVTFLPAQEEWYSGLVAYPLLLPSQLLILLVFGKVCLDFTGRRGFFVTPRRTLGRSLFLFGAAYFAVMAARYGIWMGLYSHERWVGGSIPIFLHWVLATFLILVGSYHWTRTRHLSRVAVRERWWVRWGSRLGRSAAALLVVIGVALWFAWQPAPSLLARQVGIRRAEFAVTVQRSVAMTTSDGVQLVADVYHPRRAGATTPTILVRIPYTKTLTNTLATTVVGRMWAERGYTVVVQGTRGRYESGGRHYPLRDERQDGIETLAWLAEQPWYDGRIGMWGGSAFGYTQWVLADQAGPGPSALIIQVASTDFHGMFYPGGAFSLESALHWAAFSHGERDVTPPREAMARGFDGFPLRGADDRAVGDVPFFNDWVDHPEQDGYWTAIDGEGRAGRLRSLVLLMAGWYDPFLPTQLNDYLQVLRDAPPGVASATRLVIGPWTHARTVSFPDGVVPRQYRLESLAPSVAWFDRHLLRKADSAADLPPIRLYVMGEHVWRDEQEWPLARTRYSPYYLSGGGKANTLNGDGLLSLQAPGLPEPFDSYLYNPRNPVPTAGGAMLGPRGGIARQNAVEERPDVLVYSTRPLEQDMEVTGPVRLVLYVATTAPNTDFTAKLVDVHPDGSAYNVSEGITRRSFESTTGASLEIQVDLWPTSMLFKKGHRLRLEVSSSNYPRFDRNPNTGRPIASETSPVPATQRVYHDPANPSRLILPVIPR